MTMQKKKFMDEEREEEYNEDPTEEHGVDVTHVDYGYSYSDEDCDWEEGGCYCEGSGRNGGRLCDEPDFSRKQYDKDKKKRRKKVVDEEDADDVEHKSGRLV